MVIAKGIFDFNVKSANQLDLYCIMPSNIFNKMIKLRSLLVISSYCFPLFLFPSEYPAIDFRDSVHQYFQSTPSDPFSHFRRKLENGEVTLNFNSEKQYLSSLLQELFISPHSQLLVFSTTSLQLSRISPRNPRAIYFTDDLYIGYVPGGQIEVIGIDPALGAITYIFNFPKPGSTTHPTIYRSKRCMNCHASQDIGGAPGLLIGSVIPGQGGGSIDSFRKETSGHGVAFGKRFGGWHITGQHPFNETWANQIGEMQKGNIFKIPNPPGKYFSWDKYLTESSDIIPHLLLEHQIGFTNRCITITYRIRDLVTSNDNTVDQKNIENFIQKEANSLLDYILFKDEVPLPENQINLKTRYVSDFERRSISGKKKANLKKLELTSRLLKLRCSYMIFSNSFKGLPLEFKDYIIEKLHFILSCERSKIPVQYSYLETEEREKIKQILAASMEGFPQT